MLKTLRKILLSSLSILGVSFTCWVVLLLNPSLAYSNSTSFESVMVYHNTQLSPEMGAVLNKAVDLVRSSEIYHNDFHFTLCMNEDAFYPNLYPFAGATAYAFLDKAVFYHGTPNFERDRLEFKWEINNFEPREFELSTLIAHEFMHNLQQDFDAKYYVLSTLGKLNWKFEGHAEYIAREFKNDGQLKTKITKFLIEEKREYVGIPVFELEDGTIQNLSYFKNALVVQYLMEEKGINFKEVCDLEIGLDQLYSEMIEWSEE